MAQASQPAPFDSPSLLIQSPNSERTTKPAEREKEDREGQDVQQVILEHGRAYPLSTWNASRSSVSR